MEDPFGRSMGSHSFVHSLAGTYRARHLPRRTRIPRFVELSSVVPRRSSSVRFLLFLPSRAGYSVPVRSSPAYEHVLGSLLSIR